MPCQEFRLEWWLSTALAKMKLELNSLRERQAWKVERSPIYSNPRIDRTMGESWKYVVYECHLNMFLSFLGLLYTIFIPLHPEVLLPHFLSF